MPFQSSDYPFYGGVLPDIGLSPLTMLAMMPYYQGTGWEEAAQPSPVDITLNITGQDLMSYLFPDLPTGLLRSDIRKQVEEIAKKAPELSAEELRQQIGELEQTIRGTEAGKRSELEVAPPFLQSQFLEAPRFQDIVRQLSEKPPESPLWEILGKFGPQGIQRELEALFDPSRYAAITEAITGRKPSEQAEQAIAAQLLRDVGPVQLSSGEIFNPYSMELADLVSQYRLPGEITGHPLMELAFGMLSKYDLPLTAGAAQVIKHAVETGAERGYGGKKGYRVWEPIVELAEQFKPGQAIPQTAAYGGPGGLAWAIDVVYGGRAGSGFGKGFHDWLAEAVLRGA